MQYRQHIGARHARQLDEWLQRKARRSRAARRLTGASPTRVPDPHS